MIIKGLQKTTLLDFPSKVACTVFTGGCNFRCPFCHNASLVLTPKDVPEIPEEEFFAFLQKRHGVLEGVCITGGEPLLQNDIIPFIERIHSMGFAVKLDTNGSFPDKLRDIVERGIIDYVAMDVKNCRDKYALTAGFNGDVDKIFQSIEYIMSCGIPYEFRTTVVKELHTVQDIEKLAREISGARAYYLQGFVDSDDLIGQNYTAHTEDVMRQMLAAATPHVALCQLRSI